MIVPVADVKVIVATAEATLATTVLKVGVTSVWNAVLVTLVCVLIAQLLLYVWAVRRKVPGRSPWMRMVAPREGYASLSQMQIVLWSFLFGAGAAYVMILSGSLIDIPTGALVLLGIAGATTLGSRIQGANAQTAAAAPSPSADLPTATAAPAAPTNVSVIASTDHTVTLQWDPPAVGAAGAAMAVVAKGRARAGAEVAHAGELLLFANDGERIDLTAEEESHVLVLAGEDQHVALLFRCQVDPLAVVREQQQLARVRHLGPGPGAASPRPPSLLRRRRRPADPIAG